MYTYLPPTPYFRNPGNQKQECCDEQEPDIGPESVKEGPCEGSYKENKNRIGDSLSNFVKERAFVYSSLDKVASFTPRKAFVPEGADTSDEEKG